jgi:single-strand DNA-binding protein
MGANMAGVNKVILIGNLGKDPELRRTPGGSSVASFSLATTERYVDRNNERQDKTEWHNIVAWGKLAELAHQYLKKGRSAYIEGRITNRTWDDRDGNKKYRTEIVANQIQFLGGAGGPGGSQENLPAEFSDSQEHQGLSEPSGPSSSGFSSGGGGHAVAEDDLPF